MEFLTEQRLQNARKKLHKSHPQASVSDIAMDCGFRHLGRFSQFYWKRFGERPSDTLRKGKINKNLSIFLAVIRRVKYQSCGLHMAI